MFVPEAELKPVGTIQLKSEEAIMLKWMRSAVWIPVQGEHDSIVYKAKIPEFFSSVRLYAMQGNGSSALGALELFIKRLSLQGIITKTGLYPIKGHAAQARHLSLNKADLVNLGIGRGAEEDDE